MGDAPGTQLISTSSRESKAESLSEVFGFRHGFFGIEETACSDGQSALSRRDFLFELDSCNGGSESVLILTSFPKTGL